MCGIFSILNNIYDIKHIKKNFEKGVGRGPENSQLINVTNNILGFHRLQSMVTMMMHLINHLI